MSSLPNEIKGFLTSQGVQLPPISQNDNSFLFDYLSFCISINTRVLNCIISIGCSSVFKKFLLQQEIYCLILRKCPELKYFDMSSIECRIFYFPEAKARLVSLYELKCNTSIDPAYFYDLARICQSIQRLIIINCNVKSNHGIAKSFEKFEEFVD
ncbi:9060_t:CDS:2 [Funneliformis geosporum]|nr:9060_t:CDS:2 [Funneliformis geosporum]